MVFLNPFLSGFSFVPFDFLPFFKILLFSYLLTKFQSVESSHWRQNLSYMTVSYSILFTYTYNEYDIQIYCHKEFFLLFGNVQEIQERQDEIQIIQSSGSKAKITTERLKKIKKIVNPTFSVKLAKFLYENMSNEFKIESFHLIFVILL